MNLSPFFSCPPPLSQSLPPSFPPPLSQSLPPSLPPLPPLSFPFPPSFSLPSYRLALLIFPQGEAWRRGYLLPSPSFPLPPSSPSFPLPAGSLFLSPTLFTPPPPSPLILSLPLPPLSLSLPLALSLLPLPSLFPFFPCRERKGEEAWELTSSKLNYNHNNH